MLKEKFDLHEINSEQIWCNKNALTAALRLTCLEITVNRELRRRLILHVTGFTRYGFFTSYFIDVETFYLFLN